MCNELFANYEFDCLFYVFFNDKSFGKLFLSFCFTIRCPN